MSHTARVGQSAPVDGQPSATALFDMSQRGPRRGHNRAGRASTQFERAVRQLHKLSYQDSRVAYESRLLQVKVAERFFESNERVENYAG